MFPGLAGLHVVSDSVKVFQAFLAGIGCAPRVPGRAYGALHAYAPPVQPPAEPLLLFGEPAPSALSDNRAQTSKN